MSKTTMSIWSVFLLCCILFFYALSLVFALGGIYSLLNTASTLTDFIKVIACDIAALTSGVFAHFIGRVFLKSIEGSDPQRWV